MSILIPTTTISVIRQVSSTGSDEVDRELDSYGEDAGTDDAPPERVVTRSINANIGSPSGSENILGGDQELVNYRMQCDLVDLWPADAVLDEHTGVRYDVVWAVQRSAFAGREYTQAALRRARGAA